MLGELRQLSARLANHSGKDVEGLQEKLKVRLDRLATLRLADSLLDEARQHLERLEQAVRKQSLDNGSYYVAASVEQAITQLTALAPDLGEMKARKRVEQIERLQKRSQDVADKLSRLRSKEPADNAMRVLSPAIEEATQLLRNSPRYRPEPQISVEVGHVLCRLMQAAKWDPAWAGIHPEGGVWHWAEIAVRLSDPSIMPTAYFPYYRFFTWIEERANRGKIDELNACFGDLEKWLNKRRSKSLKAQARAKQNDDAQTVAKENYRLKQIDQARELLEIARSALPGEANRSKWLEFKREVERILDQVNAEGRQAGECEKVLRELTEAQRKAAGEVREITCPEQQRRVEQAMQEVLHLAGKVKEEQRRRYLLWAVGRCHSLYDLGNQYYSYLDNPEELMEEAIYITLGPVDTRLLTHEATRCYQEALDYVYKELTCDQKVNVSARLTVCGKRPLESF